MNTLLPETAVPLLQGFSLGTPYHYLHEVGSTNDLCADLARTGAPEGTLVIAERQRTGKGRLGRTWISPPGGLYGSVLLRPCCPVETAGLLPLAAGLAVAGAMDSFGLKVGLKWPNDVLLGGRKLCGILVESSFAGGRLEHAVAGMGLNVALDPAELPPELAVKTTSLAEHLRPLPERIKVLASIMRCFERLYLCLRRGEEETVLDEYRSRCLVLGRRLAIALPDATITGRAVDITASGALLLETAAGPREIASGTVLSME